MKLTLPITIALSLFVSVCFGQVAGPKGGAPTLGTETKQNPGALAKRYPEAIKAASPDKDQLKKLREAGKLFQETVKALREQVQAGTIKRREASPKVIDAANAFRRTIKEVLTPEQYKLFEAALLPKPTPKVGG